MQFVEDPFVNGALTAAALPLIAAFALLLVLRRIPAIRPAGLAVGLAFLLSYYAILGMPPFPPVASTQKIAYIVLAGTVVGLALDLAQAGRAAARPVLWLWPTAIVVWLGWRALINPTFDPLIKLLPLWLAGLFVFDRLGAQRTQAIVAPSMVLIAGIAASVIALIGVSALLSQLAAAVAAATGGVLLWNWPKHRDEIGWSVVFAGGSALFAAASALVLFSRASLVALAILVLVFAAGAAFRHLPFSQRKVLGPLVVGAVCTVPAVVAVIAAVLTAEGSAGY